MGASFGRHDDVGRACQHGVGDKEFFADRENDDLSLCVFSARSRAVRPIVRRSSTHLSGASSTLQMLTVFISSSELRATTREDARL